MADEIGYKSLVMKFNGTIKELAARYGVNQVQMAGGIHLLVATGVAKEKGLADKPEGTKGRAAMIYEVDEAKSVQPKATQPA